SSLNPAPHGTAITFTAKVVAASGAIPTGTVTFKNGSTVIGAGALNTAGVAALAISTLPVGNASITADYGGSANDAASISAVLAETIAEAKTTTTITSSLNPAPHGTAITFT
ncbi:Ig-like domain-containing protein, partial [Granulicella sibirica]|uniref:Ig-like domain-containing protein n=1 Tax=Granulicella sibirica TaxID=2479048 RepID=UPI001237D36E